ncbi:hypothetical protein AN391_01517 [Pseudoalteromonas sp. P1-13-1a]|uniref:hypothetical protein n=1 Tax=Pseudoalteromonas sp. P1-13-1a TaxID=1723756 RepID=UPI0006D667D9|nr:hypothetical protein [Pseudoalteromonas sp. P1-13-1a]KPZ58835.1 hypothetical protein AN391_01517 [Pseudoalteromonas sp. P1-13-1a]
MHKVFVSGSMRIKNINPEVLKRIDNIINSKYQVLVGDADGVDSSIQSYLLQNKVSSVSVYCAGSQPRNNLGHWSTKNVQTNHSPGTRAFFTAKDLVMAEDCDYGLMIWDAKSTGTLSNTLELLKRKKSSLVFVNKEKLFVKVKEVEDLKLLVSHMSESALVKADKKIGLLSLIEAYKNEQSSLF